MTTPGGRLRRLVTGRQTIALAAAALLVGTLGSRALGLVRDIVLLAGFGLSSDIDAYFAAIRIPDTIFQVVTGATLASAFIPTFTSLVAGGEDARARRLAGNVLVVTTGLSLVIALAGIALADWYVPLLTPGWSGEQLSLTIALVRVMMLSPVFFAISTVVGAVLQGHQRFTLVAIAPWAYNLAIIGAVLLLGPSLGIGAAAIGAVTGALLHALVQVPGLAGTGRLVPRLQPDRDLRDVVALTLPRIAGVAAIYVNWFIVIAIATTLGEGELSAVVIAWGLMMLPLGIFGITIAQAAFPQLSALRGSGDVDGFSALAGRTLRSILVLTVPSGLALAFLGPWLVPLLYQRGAFTSLDAALVSITLLAACLGLPAHAALELFTRVFYASRNTLVPVLTAIGAVAINVPLSLTLAPVLGAPGLTLAISLATTAEVITLALVARRVTGFRLTRSTAAALLRLVLACLPLLAVLLATWFLAPLPDGFLGNLIILGLAGTSALGVFLLAARLAGLPDTALLFQRLRSLAARN